MLYGHSDPIHFMRVSPLRNRIATADTLGKIKLVEFPNIYNMITVFLYNNEDIKFCDFLNNQNLIVINSKYEMHVWNLNEFKLKNKFDLKNILNIKIEIKQTEALVDDAENTDNIKKENDFNQENTNFLKEDEYIKNVFYLNGGFLILQIRENTGNKVNFVFLEINQNDDIIYAEEKQKNINNITIKNDSHIYVSNDSKEIIFFNFIDENKLEEISKIKY